MDDIKAQIEALELLKEAYSWCALEGHDGLGSYGGLPVSERLEEVKMQLIKSGYPVPDEWLTVRALGSFQASSNPRRNYWACIERERLWEIVKQMDAAILRLRATLPASRPAKTKRPGRPKANDPAADAALIEEWKESDSTQAEFEDERGLKRGTVKRAQDRERKRRNKPEQ